MEGMTAAYEELQKERVKRLHVEIYDGGPCCDRVRWQTSDSQFYSFSIHKGATPTQALYLIDAYDYGHENGTRDGEDAVKQRFRELIGAKSDD